MSMQAQTNDLVLVHRTAVDERGHAAGSGLDNGLRDLLALFLAHQIHLAGRAAGIQAVDALANQKFSLLGHGLQINMSVLGERRGHRSDDTIQLFHRLLSS